MTLHATSGLQDGFLQLTDKQEVPIFVPVLAKGSFEAVAVAEHRKRMISISLLYYYIQKGATSSYEVASDAVPTWTW